MSLIPKNTFILVCIYIQTRTRLLFDVKESTAQEHRPVLRRKTFLIRKVSHTLS